MCVMCCCEMSREVLEVLEILQQFVQQSRSS
mgnify:CR=1 FL=1